MTRLKESETLELKERWTDRAKLVKVSREYADREFRKVMDVESVGIG